MLTLYSKRLVKERLEDVVSALEMIQDLPREEGELAFPEVGTILSTVGVCALSRRNRARMAHQTVLVHYRCPDCGVYRSGWIPPDDHAPRRCNGIPRDRRTDNNPDGVRVCGALMDEVHREAAQ
jgi:DNA-directed RNA polymerase subunit RPC12/RpoP